VDQKTEKTISSLGTGFGCDPIMATQSGIPLPIHVTKVVPVFCFHIFLYILASNLWECFNWELPSRACGRCH